MLRKVLVVDDDADIVELLVYNLQKEGYEIQTATNGAEGLAQAMNFKPDLILMDIMMPIMDGIQAGKAIKSNKSLKDSHIIYLTARSEEYSEIAAFEAGADDYITKPIKPKALMSRIQAFFRKDGGTTSKSADLQISNLLINPNKYTVTKDGLEQVLPKKEFEILHFLALNPERVFSRTELLEKIWGQEIYVVERTVDVHIRKIREKLGDETIKTLKGIGYMFPKH